MNDGIYNNIRRPALDFSTRGAASKAKAPASLLSNESVPTDSVATAVKAKASGGDQLHLSNVTKRVASEPSFDSAKVASIKQAIQDGQYPLDPRRIAESFHAIEQMIQE